jgi:hypothetical protein
MFRDDAYHNLADLIYKGFLCLCVILKDQVLTFKTINDKEYDLIKLYSGSEGSPGNTLKFNINYVVFSLVMIDGENILHQRRERYKELFDFFSKIPTDVFSSIFKELTELRRTLSNLNDYIEGFCYTNQSRQMWHNLDKHLPNTEYLTGIPGIQDLGINGYQEYWVSVNRMLDEEENYDKQFSLAVLVASASNAKGAKHLRAQHEASSQTARDKRKKVALEGTVKTINWSAEGWAAPVDTAEELVAELERQLHGYKDKHDLFIEKYLQGLKDNSDRIEKEREEAINKHRTERAPMTSSQRVLTQAETKELMARKSNNLVIVPSEDMATQKQTDRFFSKIGSKVITGK